MISGYQAIATLSSLIRHPRLKREQVVAFRNERIRRLVRHAYRHVPYYRNLFDEHGIRPEQIQTAQDLSIVPVTTRRDLQSLPPETLVAQGVDPESLIPSRSSGSSGRPMTIRRSWLEERLHNAFRWRALASYGLRATDVQVYVMLARPDRLQDNRILHRLAEAMGIGRYAVVNCFQSPEEILRALRTIRPHVVSGYATALLRIAQSMDTTALRSLRLRFIGTGGEVLTPHMREVIEQAFDAPVFDTYASIEFNVLAWQCRQTGELHTCDDGLVMEILDGNRVVEEGEQGEMMGTDLHSYAMPIIRYRLGDIVRKGSEICRCGQPFSTLRAVEGRKIDCFPLPDGRVVHPYQFNLTKVPWIREFQVTQERADRVVMRIVPEGMPALEEQAQVKKTAACVLGPEVTFEFKLVSELPFDESGKFRPYRSRVHSEYGDIPVQ
jgi:phenylacetate-coenzyme A ligase PaaK-like adenylate-forming protein